MSRTNDNDRRLRWLDAYRLAILKRPAGITKREAAEAVVIEAKRAEGDSFRISVRSLEVWRRASAGPVTVPEISAAEIGRRLRQLRE